MACDAAEIRRIDIRDGIVPSRSVEKIDRIGADREALALADLNPFAQRQVEADSSGPFQTAQIESGVACHSRLRISKHDVSGSIDNDLIAETACQRRIPTEIRQGRLTCGKAVEVFDEALADLDLAEIVRKRSQEVRRVLVVSVTQRPSRGLELERRAACPTEDAGDIPAFDDPVNDGRSIREQQPVGSKGKGPHRVSFEIVRSMEAYQAALQSAVSWISRVLGRIAVVVVAGSGISNVPGPCMAELSGEAIGQSPG